MTKTKKTLIGVAIVAGVLWWRHRKAAASTYTRDKSTPTPATTSPPVSSAHALPLDQITTHAQAAIYGQAAYRAAFGRCPSIAQEYLNIAQRADNKENLLDILRDLRDADGRCDNERSGDGGMW